MENSKIINEIIERINKIDKRLEAIEARSNSIARLVMDVSERIEIERMRKINEG